MRLHVVTPWLVTFILLLGAFGNQPLQAVAQTDSSHVQARMQIAAPSGSVVGNTYTSPQFGYSVSWENPWMLDGEPISKPGQYDDIRLTAGNGRARYIAVFSPLTGDAPFDWHFDWYLEFLKQDQPDAMVEHEYTGRTGAMVISYTRAGVPTTESVSYVDLMPGTSTLLTIFAWPTATLYQDRTHIENAVKLDLANAVTSPGNQSTTGLGGVGETGSGQSVQVQNDPERVYGDTYTIPVSCAEVVEDLFWGKVYGYCDWPWGLNGSASCIETGASYPFGEGRTYLCNPSQGLNTAVHPDEVVLENAPEKIYTVPVHCENVTEQLGTIYGDCDWPLFSSGSEECIEVESGTVFSTGKDYLCKP